MPLRITGDAARIERGYLTAATIGHYTITGTQNLLSVVGAVVDCDAYQVKQRPLMFVAQWQDRDGTRGEWRWPVLEMSLTNGRIRATLGALVKREG